MSWDTWALFTFATLGLTLTPGPNGLLSLTHGMRFGVRRTVYTVSGGCVGFLVLIAASMAGMGALLLASETAFTVAKWIGAAYLVYLGFSLWRAPIPENQNSKKKVPEQSPPAKKLFAEGFLVATSNPKALIFFAAFLPQFIDPHAPWLIQLVILGGTCIAIEFLYELVLAGSAQRIAPWLGANARWFNRIAGATFVGIGGALTTMGRS